MRAKLTFFFGQIDRLARPETVIPPFITGFKSRYQATMANFCLGVMPPSPILGRSLL